MTDDGEGNAKKDGAICARLQEANTALVDDGLKTLLRAIELRPNYDDAMSYLNLVYRRKANLECGDASARKADIAQANLWVNRAMSTRKRNAEQRPNTTP
ncbi:MAG: hypothetical protein P4L10_14820 [Acidobacteriaceae bacterium]|nr:hypothetical protein [Acidobacteriaceae bacterium]